MNQYITGQTIRSLREKHKMTQLALAEKLNVSDKTVSKWETGNGYPDISLVEPIARVFNVSVLELFSGNAIENTNRSSNLTKVKFYVCPICGNVISTIGETVVSCHGITLPPLTTEEIDEHHQITVDRAEDELYIRINHPMNKDHFISFAAAVSCNRLQVVKLYPEQDADARFKIDCIEKIYYFCNKDGLFETNMRKLNKK